MNNYQSYTFTNYAQNSIQNSVSTRKKIDLQYGAAIGYKSCSNCIHLAHGYCGIVGDMVLESNTCTRHKIVNKDLI